MKPFLDFIENNLVLCTAVIQSEVDLPDQVAKEDKSSLSGKICRGEKVVLVEMVPPRGKVITAQLKNAKKLMAEGVDALQQFYERTAKFNIPFIAGIWPLASLRNAEFMRNEVPGVTVPDNVMQRMSEFETKDDQQKAGIDIACEMEEHVRSFTAGIQVSAPFGRFMSAIKVAEGLLSK